MTLNEALRKELFLFLALHGKASTLEAVRRIEAGVDVPDIARERGVYAGDARVLANLVEGRFVYSAPTWRRRTARAARIVVRRSDELSPQIVANARGLLAAVDLTTEAARLSRELAEVI